MEAIRAADLKRIALETSRLAVLPDVTESRP